MSIFPQLNNPGQKRYRSKQRNHPLSIKSSEAVYPFKVYRSLRPVLDKIGTPAPAPFVPDPFQVEALEALTGSDVLVTAPTGAGKTYIAVEALGQTLRRGGKSWYASPLKALSNAKYEEFRELFGPENVGILTGDRKENSHAPVIVGTTEILRNQLYDIMHQGEDLDIDLVVLDEAHYLGDQDRGVVWEEVLIYLPARVRLLLLSATIQNAVEICDWLAWMRGCPCKWVAAYDRPVPLFPLFLFPGGELAPLNTRKGLLARIGKLDPKSFPRSEIPEIPRIMHVLRKANLLPAIFFLKSRSDCDKAVSFCHAAPPSERQDCEAFQKRLDELLEIFPFLRTHQHLGILQHSRVGSHHGGQLPHWKLLLEKLMQEGFLEAIFSTSTIAAGVNFPARTAVIFQSDRFNGREFVPLTATDLLQMTGRAGRRGMDEIGFALVIPGQHQDPQLINDLLKSPPDTIHSQIRVNFSMVLNLLLSHKPEEIRSLFVSSMATYQNMSHDARAMKKLESARSELTEWKQEMACGSIENLAEVRPQYAAAMDQFHKMRKALKRKPKYRFSMEQLVPGRIFLSQRKTPYICIARPDLDYRNIEAVRLAHPVRFRRKRIRSYRVAFQRIRNLSIVLESVPGPADREAWLELVARSTSGEFRPTHNAASSTSEELASQDMSVLHERIQSLPCRTCGLFGPCHKDISHPFSSSLRNYFHHRSQMASTEEQLWNSFFRHYRLLQAEGYVDQSGKLTADGLWASKLRLDQPLLISEGIRTNVFPQDSPELLAALIAPFVMDRDRQGDIQLANLVWKFPDLAKLFFKMLQNLQRLREQLQAEGFEIPPLPFWAVVTIFHWAQGLTWDKVREISGMDEGDLAMIILRTADHLRQIQALAETHPRLAATAGEAIRLLLREPVLSP